MAFCTNCGSMVPDGVKFCSNCGATVEVNNQSVTNEKPAKKTWVDKLSMFFGIILMIVAIVACQSELPALTIVLAIAIIAGAIFCLSQKYKLKGFTIIALILAVICLITGIDQGKRHGFFKNPKDADYYSSSSVDDIEEMMSIIENNKETESVVEKESETGEIVEIEETAESETKEEKQETTVPEVPEEKAEEKPEEKPEKKTEEKPASNTVDGVNPDLKAFLDSYEDFVDEYVAFMKKYEADPSNAISMLSEYSKLMDKYIDFSEKIEQYDTDEMSIADAQYYLEVTNRCAQKMLEIN